MVKRSHMILLVAVLFVAVAVMAEAHHHNDKKVKEGHATYTCPLTRT